MFGLTKSQRDAVEMPVAPLSLPEPATPETGSPSTQAELLQRWMSLATMQQRVIQALTGEIAGTSSFVETEADSLSQRFQRLAVSAQEQTERVRQPDASGDGHRDRQQVRTDRGDHLPARRNPHRRGVEDSPPVQGFHDDGLRLGRAQRQCLSGRTMHFAHREHRFDDQHAGSERANRGRARRQGGGYVQRRGQRGPRTVEGDP